MSLQPLKFVLAKQGWHMPKNVISHPIKNRKFFSLFGPKIPRNFNEYEICKYKSK